MWIQGVTAFPYKDFLCRRLYYIGMDSFTPQSKKLKAFVEKDYDLIFKEI